MAALRASQKITGFPANVQRAAAMDTANRKVLALVMMLLLSRVTCEARGVSECCRRPPHSCRLYALLCRPGGKASGGPLTGDAAAGILTLGKRRGGEHRMHNRLRQLLQGSGNQAAGILTMGKRTEDRAGEQNVGWMAQ